MISKYISFLSFALSPLIFNYIKSSSSSHDEKEDDLDKICYYNDDVGEDSSSTSTGTSTIDQNAQVKHEYHDYKSYKKIKRNESEFSLGLGRSESFGKDLQNFGELCSMGQQIKMVGKFSVVIGVIFIPFFLSSRNKN